MKPKRAANLLLSSLLLIGLAGASASCLTLNVNLNLPEAAVQRATDDYVRELYRAKEKNKGPSVETPAPKAQGFSLIPEAAAAETFTVNTPKAMQIREKLAAHLDEVIAQKRAGVLGETNDGFLELRATQGLKPLLLKKIQKVVSDENALRKELYDEVLASNKLERTQLKDIQSKFAHSFQAESPSGTWMQDSEGKWVQKP